MFSTLYNGNFLIGYCSLWLMLCLTLLVLVDLLLFFESSYKSVFKLCRMAYFSFYVTGNFLVLGKAAAIAIGVWAPLLAGVVILALFKAGTLFF